mmetsp:Transcript_62410/g.146674  ORF Transcript_62410/g.146674 Transcript_62410/m.146674 type:complete len:270 (-) Transcript_62410:128-937(-)
MFLVSNVHSSSNHLLPPNPPKTSILSPTIVAVWQFRGFGTNLDTTRYQKKGPFVLSLSRLTMLALSSSSSCLLFSCLSAAVHGLICPCGLRGSLISGTGFKGVGGLEDGFGTETSWLCCIRDHLSFSLLKGRGCVFSLFSPSVSTFSTFSTSFSVPLCNDVSFASPSPSLAGAGLSPFTLPVIPFLAAMLTFMAGEGAFSFGLSRSVLSMVLRSSSPPLPSRPFSIPLLLSHALSRPLSSSPSSYARSSLRKQLFGSFWVFFLRDAIQC